MDVFYPRDKLIGEKEDGLERELPVAEVEEIFERWAEQVKHHGVVVTFCAEPSYEGDADTSGKGFVDTCFVLQLWVFGLDALEFDGNLLARDDVCTFRSVRENKRLGRSSSKRVVKTYRDRCLQSCRYRFYGRCGTCCPRVDPENHVRIRLGEQAVRQVSEDADKNKAVKDLAM